MTEDLRRIPQKDVETRYVAGEFTRRFELEVQSPEDFVDQITKDFSEFFQGASSFVTGRGLATDNGEPAPYTLTLKDGILPNSHVIAHKDQATEFKLFENEEGITGMRLFDSGMPYSVEPNKYTLLFGLPTLNTDRDGKISIRFDKNAGIAQVKISGKDPGALVSFATGYLRGLKSGQENPL